MKYRRITRTIVVPHPETMQVVPGSIVDPGTGRLIEPTLPVEKSSDELNCDSAREHPIR